MNPNMALTPNVPRFWENLYVEGKDAWSLGKPTPALIDFFEHSFCPKKGDVLVPAAGKGWDAEAWANKGHNVLAVDFCSSAVDYLEILSNNNPNLIPLNLDMFSLSPNDEKRGGKKFDIIYDYCSFNSIHPGRRDECVEMWIRMLKDTGLLIGFFFPLNDEKYGVYPPYNISAVELEARFSGVMKIKEKIVPKASVDYRAGREEIWLLEKIL